MLWYNVSLNDARNSYVILSSVCVVMFMLVIASVPV